MRRMVVLMTLMKLDIGGAETHVIELSKSLKNKGVEVIVASFGGVYLKELEENNIKHYVVPLHKKDAFNMYKSYKMLEDIIKENNVNILHCHTRISAFLGHYLAKNIKDLAFVTTAHFMFSTKWHYKTLSRWSPHTISVSEDIRKYLVDNYNMKKSDISITVNGIDINRFTKDVNYEDVLAEFSLNRTSTKIICLTRLESYTIKPIVDLIEIGDKLYNHNNNIEIIIIGDGQEYSNLLALAEAKNKEIGKRLFIFTKGRTDVNKFLAMGDIFIGVSRSLLEAMSTRVPSIASGNDGYMGIVDASNLSDGLATNYCCRGLEAGTPEKLLKDVTTILDLDEEKRLELGEYGRKIVSEYYSIDRMSEDAIDMYNIALDSLGKTSKNNEVIISGYHGFVNNGDDAILQSIVQSLREKDKNIGITVLSKNPAGTEETFDVDSINRYDILKILKAMKGAKLLITGGGTLFQDHTSTRNVYYYALIVKLGTYMGLKSVLYANGIGPINKDSNKKLTKKVLNKVDLITLRDDESLKFLGELGVNKPKIILTADPVFSLRDVTMENKLLAYEKFKVVEGRKYVVVALREWKYSDVKFQDHIEEIVKYLFDQYQISAIFLPMQNPTDLNISRDIYINTDCHGILLDFTYTTDDVLALIDRSEFVLGMRLHSIIYALKSNKPVIALDYDPKVRAVMDTIGQQYVIDVKNIDVSLLKMYIDDVLKNLETISSEIEIKSKDLKELSKINIEETYKLLK